MFRFLLIFTLILGSGSVDGKKISDYYTSYLQPTGRLYHIFPMDFFNKSFKLDITYLEKRDSATVNFTYFTKSPQKTSSISIIIDTVYSFKTKLLYVEPQKSNIWAHRYTSTMPICFLAKVFTLGVSPTIELETQPKLIYNVKPSKWEKDVPNIQTIFQLMLAP